MSKSVDDFHCIEAGYLNAKRRLEDADVGKKQSID